MPAEDGRAQRPNVLFIVADDLNDFVDGFGGYPRPVTPHLDRLRQRAVAFTNAHSNAPLCAPSRASLLSGLAPHVTGYSEGPPRENALLARAAWMPEFLRSRGYATYGTGKVYHNGEEEAAPWTAWGAAPDFGPWPWDGRATTEHPRTPPAMRAEATSIHSFNLAALSDVPDEVHYPGSGLEGWAYSDGTPFRYRAPDDRDRTPDEQSADFALDVLAAAHDGPFFLAVGFNRPHDPLYVPDEYLARFPLETLALPPDVLPGDTSDVARAILRPGGQLPRYVRRVQALREDYGEDGLRRYLQHYLASVAFVDEQVGRILAALDASPYAPNTVVVFTSDHGYHVGEKDWLFKRSPWERATRVPLLIYAPGVTERPGATDVPVSLVDLYPTLLDLAGLPSEPNGADGPALSGHSLRPLLENPLGGTWGGPASALTLVPAGDSADPLDHHLSLRTARFRYVRARGGEEELYDHAVDPYEWRNLAADPAYAEALALVRDELRRRLLEHPTTG